MSSFYGNMKNNSRASFIFDRVYPTRTAMEAALNAVDSDDRPIGDGIFINRYVLVDYHYALSDTIITQDNIDKYYIEVDSSIVTTQNFNTFFKRVVTDDVISYTRPASFNKNDGTPFYQKKVFLDRFEIDTEISDTELQETTSNLRETDLYYAHRYTDWQNYHASYDCTVWMKIYADNKERYILVAELDAKAPVLEFIDDAPSCQNGSGHFDVRASTDLNYVYFMPSSWNMVLNKYNPNEQIYKLVENLTTEQLLAGEYYNLVDNAYILSEDEEVDSNKNYYILLRSIDTNEYWNYQDDKEHNDVWYEDYVLTQDTEVQLGKSYYNITFEPYNLEVGQSIKNLHCYISKYLPEVSITLATDISSEELYELIDGRYVHTEDTAAQDKTYYSKVENEYMVAEELVALEDVQYYKIGAIERVKDLITGDDISTSGYYEINNIKKTFNDEVEYPYFNQAGFDPKVSNHASLKGQGIFIKQVPSANVYPNHKFVHAGILTASTYLPNRYYIYHGRKVQVPADHEYNREHAYYIKEDGTNTYQLIALILNDDGQYVPARPLIRSTEKYWYDEDLSNPEYFEKSNIWEPGTAYYEITSEINEDGTRIMDHHNDTYRVDVYLPELGNTIADMYDVIYGAPIIQKDKSDGYNNLIGYCSKDQWVYYNCIGFCNKTQKDSYIIKDDGQFGTANDNKFDLSSEQIAALSPVKGEMTIIGYCTNEQLQSYTQADDGDYQIITTINDHTHDEKQYNLTNEQLEALSDEYDADNGFVIPVYEIDNQYIYPVYYMGSDTYWASNKLFDLTDEEFNALSPEIYPGVYDIPVYLKDGSNVRPYNNERLKSSLAPPYDNLDNENDISLGWSLTLLKRYLSELRQLAHGKDGEGIGLQSDWVLEDDEAFGYIYNRPTLITSYTQTTDETALPEKSYYREDIVNGEVVYTPLVAHYDKLTGADYEKYFYKTTNNAYITITEDNSTEALAQGIRKKVQVNTNASEYVNYFIKSNINDTTAGINFDYYIKPVSYSSNIIFYNFVPLDLDDYSNWFYAHSETQYFEITANNYDSWRTESNVVDTTIYKDANGLTTFSGSDYIGYYFDFDGNGVPDEIVDDPTSPYYYVNDNLNTDSLYEFSEMHYDPATFIGYYYAKTVIIYDPITNENYNNVEDTTMYKYDSNTDSYSPIIANDYIGYFYNTNVDVYIPIKSGDNGNYYRDRQKYKYDEENSEYTQVTLEDFVDQNYYYLTIDETTQKPVYEEITSSNWENINTIDIYTKVDAVVNVGNDLTKLGYVVYELPRSMISNLEDTKPSYVQCTIYSEWDENEKYFTLVGKDYQKGFYTEYNDYVERIPEDTTSASLVNYLNGYQITIDDSNQIVERVYSSCIAGTSSDSIGLYHIENEDGKVKCINSFSIIVTEIDSSTNLVYEIHDLLDNMKNLKRNQLLELLNTTLVNSYGVSYRIDSFRSNWPEDSIDVHDTEFFYARLATATHSFDVDQYHFNLNKTRYYTRQYVPVEQEDYEIHNIWNRVLEKVLQEP